MENTDTYNDIIHLPHPTSARHPRMPLHDRAAQFSPFAALTGYGDAIDETVRAVNAAGDGSSGYPDPDMPDPYPDDAI